MSQELRVIAHVKVHPDQIETLKKIWLGTLEATRAAPGVVAYEVHQSTEDPTKFMAFEIYESPEAFQAHLASPRTQDLLNRVAPLLIAPPDIHTLVRIA